MSPSRGMQRERGFELRDRRVDLAARVQRDGVDVGEARVARFQPGRARELAQRRVAAIQARQRQAERVVQRAALRRARRDPSRRMRSPSASRPCARYTSARLTYAGIEDGSMRIADCSSASAAGRVTALGQEGAEIDARLGAIGVVALRLDELGGRALERDLSLRGSTAASGTAASMRAASMRMALQRIGQQRLGQPHSRLERKLLDGLQRAESDERARIAQRRR